MGKYARRSSNTTASTVALHMNGFSHGKAAKFVNDSLKTTMSRSTAYRNKIGMGKNLAPERDRIKQDIMKEPVLNCDEMWWTIIKKKKGGKKGRMIIVIRGSKVVLTEVVESADIKQVKKMLKGYEGIVVQDSKTIWMHVGWSHQLCMWHQHRICKRDMESGKLKGGALEFVTALDRVNLLHYEADKI